MPAGADGAVEQRWKTNEKGEFVRPESPWRNWVKVGSEKFPPEAGRYHLYMSYACGWANGCYAAMRLKGLEGVIGTSIVHPTWQKTDPETDDHSGWAFTDPDDPPVTNQKGHGSFGHEGVVPDTVNNAKFVRDLYKLASGDDAVKGPYTVPVLWCKKTKTIVSNESMDILKMLNSEFNEFAKNPDVDLFPNDLADVGDKINSWVYPNINNGAYRCGLASTQEAYDIANDQLYEHLDKAEALLSEQRYLCGSRMTWLDIRLYMTLVRFDPVYVVYFKCSRKRISDYPNLFNYLKDMYQIPEIKAVTNFYHIKTHYFTSHPHLNVFAIVPKCSDLDVDLNLPHDRDRFGPGFSGTAPVAN
mmetsp:Transcript_20511/g.48756  ORF Transcript_20511/g.48756 Transcript_20511/m.48756 type:complete len:358 (+) Transcript_20511:61-1134(+)